MSSTQSGDWQGHAVEPGLCPHCGAFYCSATQLDDRTTLEHGDVIMCRSCAGAMVLDGQVLRSLTEDEVIFLLERSPVFFRIYHETHAWAASAAGRAQAEHTRTPGGHA